ncbi:MAG: HNH endonuclease signature motif containing protein [Candidatus Aenigmatarchaeota archaeon]
MASNPLGIKIEPIDLGFNSSRKSGRDKRRSFTRSQKNEILYQQGNKCAICHKPLDPRDIEYDHKKPWASGGRTITINGRALCGSCHNKVSHKTRLKKSR